MLDVPANRHHPPIAGAVIVGVSSIVLIFMAIVILWIRKGMSARKSAQIFHSSKITSIEIHPGFMAYFQPHKLSVQLPKPPPRVYDPGRASITPPEPFWDSKPGRSSDLETCEPRSGGATEVRTETLPTSLPNLSLAAFVPKDTRCALESEISLSSLWDEMQTQTDELRQRIDSGEVSVTMEACLAQPPSESGSISSSRLSAPFETREHSAAATQGNDYKRDTTIGILSPPPTPARPDFSVSQLSQSSVNLSLGDVQESETHESETHEFWSDIFSLEEYGHEDHTICVHSAACVHEQLPSPPPTPTVFCTPPSPPTALPVPAYLPKKLDVERLHAWESSLIATEINDGEIGHNSGEDGFRNFHGGVTALALTHEHAKVAQARRIAKFYVPSGASRVREESPPPYQSLGFDYVSRLALKRGSSPFADISSCNKNMGHNLLDKVSAVVRPRPPLPEFEPLLYRKVDVSKLRSRQPLSKFEYETDSLRR